MAALGSPAKVTRSSPSRRSSMRSSRGLGEEGHQLAGRPLPGGHVLRHEQRHAVVEVGGHLELAARALLRTVRALARLRAIPPALPVEGDLRARKGGPPLRERVRLQAKHAALRVRRGLVVDRAVLELEQEATVDLVAAHPLPQLAVPDQRSPRASGWPGTPAWSPPGSGPGRGGPERGHAQERGPGPPAGRVEGASRGEALEPASGGSHIRRSALPR